MSTEEDRYWLLEAPVGLPTHGSSRIHEVQAAANYPEGNPFPVVGLVDEECGGVIGYLHADFADDIVDILNGIEP